VCMHGRTLTSYPSYEKTCALRATVDLVWSCVRLIGGHFARRDPGSNCHSASLGCMFLLQGPGRLKYSVRSETPRKKRNGYYFSLVLFLTHVQKTYYDLKVLVFIYFYLLFFFGSSSDPQNRRQLNEVSFRLVTVTASVRLRPVCQQSPAMIKKSFKKSSLLTLRALSSA
jgi:hypothetical protein